MPLRTIVPAMIGTAGHVDHGKSSLVAMLTGCRMDRRPEEAARGLTIDLGFAALPLPGGRLAGVVDVPGHRDFIRNMVAGAATIDVLLLVVAADDGPMPQTREHLLIARLLGTSRLVVAVTKIDLVAPAQVQQVITTTTALVGRHGFAQVPVLAVSNRSGDGIDLVREALIAAIDSLPPRPERSAFRLFIERGFSIEGHGTVATGIPLGGSLRPGDQVRLHPAGTDHVVRGIQSYHMDQTKATCHACAAVVLRDCPLTDVVRGAVLAAPGAFAPTTSLIAELINVSGDPLPRRLDGCTFHAGTAGVAAAVRFLSNDDLPAEVATPAWIRLESPLVLAAGDRCVLRAPGPNATLAGGRVLGVEVVRRPKDAGPRLAAARQALEQGDHLSCELLAGGPPVVGLARLQQAAQEPDPAAALRLAQTSNRLSELAAGQFLIRARTAELLPAVLAAVDRHHADHPAEAGLEPSSVCTVLDLPPACAPALLAALVDHPAPATPDADRLIMQQGRLARAGFHPRLNAAEQQQLERIRRALRGSGAHPPALGDLLSDTGLAEAPLRKLVRHLIDSREAAWIGHHLVEGPVLETWRQAVRLHFTRTPTLDLATFRTLSRTGRNLAVATLEHFDHEGLTRRAGPVRVRGG